MTAQRVLVTGGGGYLGSQVVAALAERGAGSVVCLDVRELPPERRRPGVAYAAADIRDRAPLEALLREHRIDTVVHLAAIVTPGKKADRDFEYQVDVVGTKNVLDACVAAGVGHVVISSSGAAYGYHADNPAWLSEVDAIRGNEEFAYSWHKRLVEEMLADYRKNAPQLQQTIFRIGTILGETVSNQITALFDKPRPLAIAGSDSPFVFIWDQDVVGAILHALGDGPRGHLQPRRRRRADDPRDRRRAWASAAGCCRRGCCKRRCGSASASGSPSTAPSNCASCAFARCSPTRG